MKIKNLFNLFILTFVLQYCFGAHAESLSNGITVSNSWIQAMPPSQNITAAYMDITNKSSNEVILVSASCGIASATEIHQMSDANGMMHMAMKGNIPIPALSKVSLAPGGYHLMLIGLKKPLNMGDIVPVTLHFQDGSSMMVNAQVKSSQEDSSSMPGMKL